MPREDGPDLVRFGQGLVEFHRGSARVGKDRIDPFAYKAFDDDLGALHLGSDLRLGE